MNKLLGDEVFVQGKKRLSWTVVDFLLATTDILNNVTRGKLAEYIVQMALGTEQDAQDFWAGYDVKSSGGIRVQVKSAAYIQSWVQKQLSTIQFSIGRTCDFDAQTGMYSQEPARNSDVYVFCLLAHKERNTINPLDLDQWEFYVLPTKALESCCPTHKTISLRPLLKLGPIQCRFNELETAILRAGK